jgi:hypothetical protein
MIFMKRKTMKPIRQGDVIFIPTTETPEGGIKRHNQLTVALGEATGHHHTLYPIRSAGLYAEELPENPELTPFIEEFTKNNKRFIKLDTEWLLRHQEHHEIRIPPGTYEIGIEKEYDPFEENMKKVVD